MAEHLGRLLMALTPCEVTALLGDTCRELARALDCFYPVEGNNDLPEALIAGHLAFQLRDRGYFVYPQVQRTDAVSEHLDLVAVSPTARAVIAVEAKRLHNSAQARSLGRDWQRLRTARVTSDWRRIPAGYAQSGCLLATTWEAAYRHWWADPERPATPGSGRSAADWADLRTAPGGAAAARTGHVPLPRLGWDARLYVLLAFVPLPAAGEAAEPLGPGGPVPVA